MWLVIFFESETYLLGQWVILFAPCEESVTNILHLVRRSVGKNLIRTKNVTDDDHSHEFFKNKNARSSRHDLSDACHWVSEGTVAVLAVSTLKTPWEGIDTNAHEFKLPHLVTTDTCSTSCSLSPLVTPQHLELAIFEYLKNEYLHDVIMLHDDIRHDGELLSYLLNSNGVRISHIQAEEGPSFFKTVERYFDTWNMADLTDEGRLMVSLGNGNTADQLLMNLVASSMHNKRTKILVVGGVRTWQDRLLQVTAYEVDLLVISRESVPASDCPLAIEVLPTGVHGHEHKECQVLSPQEQNLGHAILRNIRESLMRRHCCSPLDEYTFWKSFPAENGTQRLRPVAVWANDTGLLRMETLDLETITIRIAVVQYRPYIVYNVINGEIILDDCVLKDILGFISERLNFKYQLLEAPGDDWGTKIDNEWTGAIGMIVRGEVDMIPYLTITPSRYDVIEFSKPIAIVTYGLLIAFPREPPRAFIYLRLYKKEVWVLLFFTAIFLSYVLCKMQSCSAAFRKPEFIQKKLCSFCRCLWLIFGILLQQGATYLPLTSSGRILLATWWLSVLVITTTYSANLIAFLAIPEVRFIVKSLEELADHKTVSLTLKQGCPILEELEQSETELYRRIRETYLLNPRRHHKFETGVKRCCAVEDVVAGKSVYIDDVNYLSWMVERDFEKQGKCRITIAPKEFGVSELAVGLRRGSSLLLPLNDEIQQMRESGVLSHWKKKYSPAREECYSIESDNPGQREVNLEDLQGPFYLLLLGIILGFLLFMGETTYSRLKKIIRKDVKPMESQILSYERRQLSFF
ncbi:Ionotropic receptor 93a like protein [Argiope bruennichi]|uniref:Ionotropic receptor 93a like protein n=1 Tax=Argiope bruennichi TaxID=94029 RepID=A0A8T0FXT7_ARGBR|nr:Ionotropic receptor 93a like protein [Argiope bruennichi]